MKKITWQIILGILLIVLSIFGYLLHFIIFRDAHHILIYLIGDIAFVFFEILLVTLVIHRLLEQKEKKEKLEKINMIIGVFFSKIGTKFLTIISDADPDLNSIKNKLIINTKWTNEKFFIISKKVTQHKFNIDITKIDVLQLKKELMSQSDFLTRLFENPILFEHESFTELLRSVFHLLEELSFRENIEKSSETDLKHIEGDIKRCYKLLVIQWLFYMRHLKNHYPYLYSLSIRTNPFDESATIFVKDN